jgi:antitoxin (DNA-binding transcriptional repressor) of toxin-antitoxin stability system
MEVPAVDLMDFSQRLLDLVDKALRSGEIVLTRGGEAVAKIVPLRRARRPRRPGSARGVIIYMRNDFQTTPEDIGQIP